MPAASRSSRTASRSDRGAASLSAPVGFFDSGVGGLCVREAFRRRLPHEDTVYIADTANCPYGNRPAAEIVRLARRHVRALLARGCKMV
ncbi:MAG: glutamate racemase, partial [Kiritimatiellae bacterium]|nr:glutamate racemase [Kiritimatiellia bacterium]